MKRLLYVLLVLVTCSAFASAASYDVRGGVIMGNTQYGNDDYTLSMGGAGLYIGGNAVIDQAPVAITGSFSAYSGSEVKIIIDGDVEDDADVDSKSALLKVFAGYRLPTAPVAVGVGLVSQQVTLDYGSVAYSVQAASMEEKIATSGLAIAAFGSVPAADKVTVYGELYFAPAAQTKYEDEYYDIDEEVDSSILGLEAVAAYQVNDQISVEAGYRLSKVTFKEDDMEGGYRVGGLFVGGRFRF